MMGNNPNMMMGNNQNMMMGNNPNMMMNNVKPTGKEGIEYENNEQKSLAQLTRALFGRLRGWADYADTKQCDFPYNSICINLHLLSNPLVVVIIIK